MTHRKKQHFMTNKKFKRKRETRPFAVLFVCTYVRSQEPSYDYLLGAVSDREQAHAKHTEERQRFEMRHMGAAAEL